MRHRRILVAALTASGLAAGGALAITSHVRAADTPAGCDDIRAYQERFGEIETLGGAGPEVTVLGDSYSAGDSVTDRGRRWTDALAAGDPRLTVELDAIAFTGFVNTGDCGRNSYRDRIERAVAETDTALVIQGGLNDVYAEPETVARAADAVLEETASLEHVVVVGPIDAPGRKGEAEVDAVLAAAAREHGATYVSTLKWELPFGEDRVHLTTDGHRAYADRIRRALLDLGAV